jgi:hypothetical protein
MLVIKSVLKESLIQELNDVSVIPIHESSMLAPIAKLKLTLLINGKRLFLLSYLMNKYKLFLAVKRNWI